MLSLAILLESVRVAWTARLYQRDFPSSSSLQIPQNEMTFQNAPLEFSEFVVPAFAV